MTEDLGKPKKLKKPIFMKPSSDIVFKMLFGGERSISILKDFLLSVLEIPEDDYESISIIDPHLLAEHADGKQGILDIKLRTVSGRIINIEVQVRRVTEMRERLAFYIAKLISEQIGKGDDYNIIKQTVQITIAADFELLPETSQYKHRFLYYDPDEEAALTDISLIYTLELPKLPRKRDGTTLWDWLCFIGAKNKEEIEMASETNPEIKKAAKRLEQLSADPRARMLYEAREKEMRDIRSHEKLVMKEAAEAASKAIEAAEAAWKEASEAATEAATEAAWKEATEAAFERMLEVAKSFIQDGVPIERVMKHTGLSRSDIDSIVGESG